jgi:uncharacterized membrane protein YphA (DoxX/SURF4 family)
MGLLLLRLAVATVLAVEGVSLLIDAGTARVGILGLAVVLMADSGALAAGFLTPVAALLAAALTVVGLVLAPGPGPDTSLESAPVEVLLLVMTTAIGLLGPGGFSADARLFGRRRILVPPPSDLPRSGDAAPD